MAKWVQRTTDANIELMAQTLGVHACVATAMANRGVRSRNQAANYLCPNEKNFHEPALFKDIEEAVKIVADCIEHGVRIAVYGDYDVDGVTGTVILCKILRERGADVIYYIPHRELEGYGLNSIAVERLIEKGVGLVVTCDNGVASEVEIALLSDAGIKTIVIDHHEPPEAPCGAAAMVNPKQAECEYPFDALCAGGLAYKFSKSLYNYYDKENPFEDEFLVFAAIASFCDVVDLQGENRLITQMGLKLLNDGRCNNIGLKALLTVRQLEDKEIGAFDIGFIIGPCINATGRLDRADIAVDLFLTEDEAEAQRLAAKLVLLNDERKALTSNSVELVLEEVVKPEWAEQKVLVLFKPEIHESIAGIVAGRVKEAVNKPTIIISRGRELAKGSARSIEGYNIFDELSKNTDLFERFGGHAMAAGLSLKEENIDELRRRLNETCSLTEDELVNTIYFDNYLELSEATFELAQQITMLKPFGKANHEPLFVTRGAVAESVDLIGATKTTLRFSFATETPNGKNRWLKGICFGKAARFIEMMRERYSEAVCANFEKGLANGLSVVLDIIYSLEINEFNGNTSVQLNVKDFVF